MRRLLLVPPLVLATCDDGPERIAASLSTTTTTATSTAPTTTSTTATTTTEPADPVSIHVEGDIPYERHRAGIDELATEAAQAGVVLTLGTPPADDFVASLAALELRWTSLADLAR